MLTHEHSVGAWRSPISVEGWENLGLQGCIQLKTFTYECLGLWPRIADLASETLLIDSILPQLPVGLERFRWLCTVPFLHPKEEAVKYIQDYPWTLLARTLSTAAPRIKQFKVRLNRFSPGTDGFWEQRRGLEEEVRNLLVKGGYKGEFVLAAQECAGDLTPRH